MDTDSELVKDAVLALCLRGGGGLIGSCRRILEGDELTLRESERLHLRGALPSLWRASGAVRIIARGLVVQLGGGDATFARAFGKAAEWPKGLIGSLAHDATFAIAVAAPKTPFRSVGVDIEPNSPLPPGLIDFLATPRERHRLRKCTMPERLLFCIKEAVYKATNPIDGIFLEPQDIEFDADSSIARTSTGHTLDIFTEIGSWLLALACL